MPSDAPQSYGVIRFMAAKSFHAMGGGLEGDAFQEWVTSVVTSESDAKLQSTHDWPKISEAIRRDGMFILEVSTPAFGVMLGFSADSPTGGDYTILRRPRDDIERGHTTEVAQITQESLDVRVSMLNPFKTRFVVKTVNSKGLTRSLSGTLDYMTSARLKLEESHLTAFDTGTSRFTRS